MSTLCSKIADLQTQAEAISVAVECSQSFWRAMRNGLPGGCRAPLSPTCRWRRGLFGAVPIK